MSFNEITSLTKEQVQNIREFWQDDSSFIGYPDAERDTTHNSWFDNLLVQPKWFKKAISPKTTVTVARKGAGKSAVRLTSIQNRKQDFSTLIVEVSADELASLHSERLKEASGRGYGAVADWIQIYADLICRKLAQGMSGQLLVGDDEAILRAWAKIRGVTERDFGERIIDVLKTIIPWVNKVSTENSEQEKYSPDRFNRIMQATKFVLYVDDFDNLQEEGNTTSIRLIRDAVEAADRITHDNKDAEVHLFMRQDLWLSLNPGWHYADKISGVMSLNWDFSELKEWFRQRLRLAIGLALEISPALIKVPFNDMWHVFFEPEVTLKNKETSDSFSYIVRRTMYTPRSLGNLIKHALDATEKLPVSNTEVYEAEWSYSIDQLEFLKTEFRSLCKGLDICLQSFTGKPLEWTASNLYRHLKGLIGNGQVKLKDGVLHDANDEAVALARFLFRIGFLEVRYPEEGRFEVRDVMRHPDHWKSVRTDDAVRWAVRSAFFNGLKSHREY